MVLKCKNCGEPIVRFPLRDNLGNFLWKNLFKMSIDSIVLIMVIVALIVAYNHDTKQCREIIEDPLTYCDRSNACRILAELEYRDKAGVPIFELPKNEDGHIP